MRQIISTLSFIVSLSSFAAHPVEDLLNRIDSGASQKFVIIQTCRLLISSKYPLSTENRQLQATPR
jgi:hypothetical protein